MFAWWYLPEHKHFYMIWKQLEAVKHFTSVSILEAPDFTSVTILICNRPSPPFPSSQEQELWIILGFAKRSRQVYWCLFRKMEKAISTWASFSFFCESDTTILKVCNDFNFSYINSFYQTTNQSYQAPAAVQSHAGHQGIQEIENRGLTPGS